MTTVTETVNQRATVTQSSSYQMGCLKYGTNLTNDEWLQGSGFLSRVCLEMLDKYQADYLLDIWNFIPLIHLWL